MIAALLAIHLSQQTALSPSDFPAGHSHNDYSQKEPLVSALKSKFRSIEADVFPVNNDLWVSHDKKDLTPNNTLLGMYLTPLSKIISENKGSVYGDGKEMILLVDIKTDGVKAYETLKAITKPFRSILSSVENGKLKVRAIRIILSGARSEPEVDADNPRFAFLDGRWQEADKPSMNSLLTPLMSESWQSIFPLKFGKSFTPEDRTKLRAMVEKVHSKGQILRFWATPEDPTLWKILAEEKVDLIGTDKHELLVEFLQKK